MICSVAVCKNNSKKAKETGEKCSFFRFPKDPKIRKEWVQKCFRKDKWDPKHKRICDRHFKEDDYEDALKARLLHIQPKRLKATAIPSLFLKPKSSAVEETSTENQTHKKHHQKIAEAVLSSSESVTVYDPLAAEKNCNKENIITLSEGLSIEQENKYVELLKKYEELKKKQAETQLSLECEQQRNWELQKMLTYQEEHVHEKVTDIHEKNTSEDNCSASSSSSTASDTSKKWAEKDGIEYVAGFIARKFIHKYPNLGDYTHKKYKEIHSYSLPTWVQGLSFGGLIEPSASWLKKVFLMEKYFLKFHKETFNRGEGIIKKTTNYISKKMFQNQIEIMPDLIQAFVRQRIFIRIKYLNINKHSHSVKRQAELSLDRKLTKKMRKTVT